MSQTLWALRRTARRDTQLGLDQSIKKTVMLTLVEQVANETEERVGHNTRVLWPGVCSRYR